jgi:hypothetical protein
MKKEEFDNKKFKESMGYRQQPLEYDYQKYLYLNPKLTVKMYEHCRINKCLWKIECGKRIHIHFTNETLEEIWWHNGTLCNDC